MEHPAIKRWTFEYWYMIVMVIYASHITTSTSRMNYGLSGDPIPFLIPIILTFILLKRNSISFGNRQLAILLSVTFVWIILITLKVGGLYLGFQSYNFFLIYAIIIAYIHIKVYGKSIVDVYEDIMVRFSIISLVFWLFGSILPNVASSFFQLFPEVKAVTGGGNHIFYIYNWFNPAFSSGTSYVNLTRNSGCCFEPGYFASMLCLAILCNVLRKGLNFKNKNFWILSFAILTTFSTTGYITYAVILTVYYINTVSFVSILKLIFIVAPLFYLCMNLNFMGDKIIEKGNLTEENHRFFEAEIYHARQGTADFHVSLDRIQSLYFEFQNIFKDPILGYSRDVSKSWFGRTFLSNYSLTGGLLKIIGQFGIIFGLFIYFILFNSSKVFGKEGKIKKNYILALTMMIISISYGYFGTPIFMTFWLYGAFGKIKNRLFVS